MLEGHRKKEPTEVKNELSLDVALLSQVSDGKEMKKSTDWKDELSTLVALPS